MNITGNSSATVKTAIDSSGKTFIRKSCRGESSSRLLIQALKQKSFLSTEIIRTPEIFNISKSDDECYIDMEHITGLDFVTFTSKSSINEFSEVISSIISFLNKEIESSDFVAFPRETWIKKVEDLKLSYARIGIREDFVNKVEHFLMENIPDKVLVGPCHGDLTFSNILVENERELVFFDFLNPPIESPYEDVSKILQDVEFYWTLLKFSGSCDRTRVKIMWKSAKVMILDSLRESLDMKTLRLFQVMTLARVIPYTADRSVVEYLISCIEGKILEVNTSMWW